MPEQRIDSASASDLKNVVDDFSVASASTDATAGTGEYRWINREWEEQFGYYTDDKIPEITALIDAKSTWTVGKGFIADEVTTMLLDTIKGIGIDSFNTLLENAMRTMLIGGDFFVLAFYFILIIQTTL